MLLNRAMYSKIFKLNVMKLKKFSSGWGFNKSIMKFSLCPPFAPLSLFFLPSLLSFLLF